MVKYHIPLNLLRFKFGDELKFSRKLSEFKKFNIWVAEFKRTFS